MLPNPRCALLMLEPLHLNPQFVFCTVARCVVVQEVGFGESGLVANGPVDVCHIAIQQCPILLELGIPVGCIRLEGLLEPERSVQILARAVALSWYLSFLPLFSLS